MIRVAPVSLGYNPRALWFDPGDLALEPDSSVVVETARGIEFGRMVGPIIEVEEAQVKKLKSPLKPVKRVADEEDIARAAEMDERGREALPVFKQLAAEYNEDMHPVSVEFLLDGDKAVFYFEAEERVDFRDLVRKLASEFHVRIDMRQIGVRDEARLVGGLGHCGQELCCKRLGGEFCPVSIRMAKEQNLSLNPQKISGLCGRLMCCLRYEYDAYKDFKQRAPKVGAKIATPEGDAVVTELDVPREEVALKVGDEKPVRVPLSGFVKPEEGRPKAVTEEAWDEAKAVEELEMMGGALTFLTSQFTGADKVARGARARRIDGEATEKGERSGSGRRRRSRSGSGGGRSGSGAKAAPAAETRKPRRRRSTKIADGEVVETKKAKQDTGSSSANRKPRRRTTASGTSKTQQSKGGSNAKPRSNGPRPGQRSSGLRNADAREGSGSKPRKASGTGQNKQGSNKPQAEGASKQGDGQSRRRRRRSHSSKTGGEGGNSGSSAPSASSSPKGDA